MKIYAGRTFMRANAPGKTPHLWIVLTEPSGNPATVAVVNLTSDAPDKDATVRLGRGDYPFIRKPTVVFYAMGQIIDASTIEDDVQAARATFHDDCSEDLLETVRQGVLASKFASRV
jgi:hypothetical protein